MIKNKLSGIGSCGWRSTDTDDESPMLRQVKDHLNAVRAFERGSAR